jgi:hypothetical protein
MVVAFSASILCIASVHLASAAIRRSFSVQQGISLQPDLVGRHSHVVCRVSLPRVEQIAFDI